jgi:arylsulfatase A-like enzyme
MLDSEYRKWFEKNAPDGVTPDDHGVGWNSWHARPWHTEERLHPTYWTMTRSLEFLKNHDPDRPFFLNISFARPHSPYVPPKHYFDMYYCKGDLPEPAIAEWSEMHNDPETARKLNAWRGKMDPEQIKLARAGYYGSITFIDTQIGRLMNWIERRGNEKIKNNTWFLFTSDHGDMQGDHNLWRKTYAYEGSTRIPFFVVPPFRQEPERNEAGEVVELQDVMPTLLEAAGLPIPNTVDGHSVLPLMEAPAKDWREYIHGEHCTCYSEEQEMQFVTDGRRKYIWLTRIDKEQFFNLDEDPGETHNLINDSRYKAEIEKWRGYLVHELEKRDCGWVKDGKPYCPNNEPLVSPYKNVRWQGPNTLSQ